MAAASRFAAPLQRFCSTNGRILLVSKFSYIIIFENWTSAGYELVEGKREVAGRRVEHHAVRPVAPSHKSAARQFADDPVAGLHRHCVASETDRDAGTVRAAAIWKGKYAHAGR